MYLFRDRRLYDRREMHMALLTIYGVGRSKAFNVVSRAGIGYPHFIKNVSLYQYTLISCLLKCLVISSVRIRRRVEANINIMVENTSYQGLRHRLGLPVRGQRTRTNAGTQRAKRIRIRKTN